MTGQFDIGAVAELRQKLGLYTTAVQAISASDRKFSGTVQIVGSGVTVGTTTNASGSAVLISAAAGGGASMGVSTGGNTAGNTTVNTGTRFVLAGAGAATLSQATAAGATTVTVSVPTQTVQTQNVHNVTLGGNTTGTLAHISSGTLTLAGGSNVTLSQNGNAVTISAGAGGGGGRTLQSIMNLNGQVLLTRIGTSNATFAVVPLTPGDKDHGMPGAFTGTQFGIYLFGSNTATASSSGAGTYSYSFGIYTKNAGSLSLLNSASTSYTYGANGSNTSLYHGTRILTLNSSQWSASLTFAENSVYYLAYWLRSSGQAHALSWVGQSIGTTGQFSGLMYTSTATATSMGLGMHLGGQYSASFTTGIPTSIPIFTNSINRAVAYANFVPYVKIEA